jgi:ferrochelatase
MSAVDSVLLITFGGPNAPHEIRPFLQIVTRRREIPAERLEEVARHYEQMPRGRSPLSELTFAQAHGLEQALAQAGAALPVFVGMRNWHPFLRETLTQMADRGARRALGVILSPLRTEASWDRYMEDVADARAGIPNAPEIVFAPPWFDHPDFVAAVAERTRASLDDISEDTRRLTPLVFTAHSVPVAMAEASPYVADLTAASGAVAASLEHRWWSIAYQSRSGSRREPWLEPDIASALVSLARAGERNAVVVPIGFVCDHVEVLYDLDVEARRVGHQHGIRLHRAAAVNDHPRFIAMLTDLVRKAE